MASKRSRKKSCSRSVEFVQNPRGVIHPRVQKVGPEHFGIVSIDCAKVRSKWMLADFYGNVCIPPTEVAHNRVELDAAVARVRAGLAQHGLQDCLVAIERTGRSQEIITLERSIAQLLCRTPYVLLLSIPGINVVSAADFAGEMGPIENYANHRAITGRAGLFPARYQSDRVDHSHALARRANRSLRTAILGIADNLMRCNRHFGSLAVQWKLAHKDPRLSHVKVASRFCRIAFHMVAGRQGFRHPGMRERSYFLDKLIAFHAEHCTPWLALREDLDKALTHIPAKERKAEAIPLVDKMHTAGAARKKGPQLLSQILPFVLARLGIGAVPSIASGEEDLT